MTRAPEYFGKVPQAVGLNLKWEQLGNHPGFIGLARLRLSNVIYARKYCNTFYAIREVYDKFNLPDYCLQL